VKRLAVFKNDNAKCLPIEFVYVTPITNTPIGLYLALDRVGDDLKTPLNFQIWPLPKNLLNKVRRHLHID